MAGLPLFVLGEFLVTHEYNNPRNPRSRSQVILHNLRSLKFACRVMPESTQGFTLKCVLKKALFCSLMQILDPHNHQE